MKVVLVFALVSVVGVACLVGCSVVAGLGSAYVGASDGGADGSATEAAVDSQVGDADGGPPDAGESAAPLDASDAGPDATLSYTVGGTLTGLASGSVTLQDNGSSGLVLSADGTFTFPTPVASGATYVVSVQTQPEGQICSVENASGTVANATVADVVVHCATTAYLVGGTVSGLVTGDTLVLLDNGGDTLDVMASGMFSFVMPVATGALYKVTIETQPTAPVMSCSVMNGAGTMGMSNVMNVAVVCSTVAFAYTGSDQTWVVPPGTSSITVKLWGAGGGGGGPGGWAAGFPGGAGGFTRALIMVSPGETLTVVVGQAGAFMFPEGTMPTYGGGGGYLTATSDNRYGGSGGGRSAIQMQGVELVTAGGGGGGGASTSSNGSNAGGAGGGAPGEDGSLIMIASGETAAGGGGASTGGGGGIAAGAPCDAGATIKCGVSGTAGGQYVGASCGYFAYGGAGGGGWYGGGSGAFDSIGAMGTMGGGGGGSGYAAGPGVMGLASMTGFGASPPATTDPDYQGEIGIGGPVMGTGGNGLVVIAF